MVKFYFRRLKSRIQSELIIKFLVPVTKNFISSFFLINKV